MTPSKIKRYKDELENAPERGGGLHPHLLRIANLGRVAGVAAETIIDDCNELDGIRHNEAREAVEKAFSTAVPHSGRPAYAKPILQAGAFENFIEGQTGRVEDLTKRSPCTLQENPEVDVFLLLLRLYRPDDLLFIGNRFDTTTVKTVREWMEEDLTPYEYIIPNPLSGDIGLTSNGTPSLRCEETVADLRFAVCEMDGRGMAEQAAFWQAMLDKGVPIAAIIYSGGKSLHAWVRVDCGTDSAKWASEVRGWLFERFGAAYGIDAQCKTKARLSRLPGHMRGDTGKEQTLYYLDGGASC